ncbi:Hcp family type VI secretion system effector [Rahnella perminowiae]|uniref:Type VI secretion system tube protein Hcp n=1 Tax=Rahnella perminowiae TaxID=2816244 RepID=A0ABS6L4E3_9GAMM|nr:type VI secretion system tube protein Hcp [Rahnella perminowiae]MBU9836545.1 type VI secretion system tube protein Hcp [Rahnella perminowiae]MCR9003361.1 type VI secretion system tube protein Hcp [Rahnella perminowiae]UJD91827.1 type VI secretion system tube protein Hcp [Rahnella aquatilis]
MATESLFMKIEGIKGTVSNKGYEGWISIENMTFGVSSTPNIDNASEQVNGAGARFDSILFSKVMDSTSTQLTVMVAEGSNISEITLVKVSMQGSKPVEAAKLIYKNCVLSSYNFNAYSAGDIPCENLSFVYGAMSFETNMVEPDGKTSKQGPMGWSVIKNNKL